MSGTPGGGRKRNNQLCAGRRGITERPTLRLSHVRLTPARAPAMMRYKDWRTT